jgi:hypothetical protein
MLSLFPIADRDHSFLAASELRLEISQHLGLGTLSPDVGNHLHAAERVVVIERC